MSTQMMMELAETLATELIDLSRRRGMTKHEVLMLVALSERMLQKVLLFDDVTRMRMAMDEADATLKAFAGEVTEET